MFVSNNIVFCFADKLTRIVLCNNSTTEDMPIMTTCNMNKFVVWFNITYIYFVAVA